MRECSIQTKGPAASPMGPSLEHANVVHLQDNTTAVLLVPILCLCNSSEELAVTGPDQRLHYLYGKWSVTNHVLNTFWQCIVLHGSKVCVWDDWLHWERMKNMWGWMRLLHCPVLNFSSKYMKKWQLLHLWSRDQLFFFPWAATLNNKCLFWKTSAWYLQAPLGHFQSCILPVTITTGFGAILSERFSLQTH